MKIKKTLITILSVSMLGTGVVGMNTFNQPTNVQASATAPKFLQKTWKGSFSGKGGGKPMPIALKITNNSVKTYANGSISGKLTNTKVKKVGNKYVFTGKSKDIGKIEVKKHSSGIQYRVFYYGKDESNTWSLWYSMK